MIRFVSCDVVKDVMASNGRLSFTGAAIFMQSYTPIHSRFWSDSWVRELNALDRYLFLYLLTNGRAGLTGIYELPLDLMAAESGIDVKDLKMAMLSRLEPKVYYREGWVIIVNFVKHHLTSGPKFFAGVRNDFDKIPPKIRELAIGYGYPIHTLSIGYTVSRNRIEENRIEERREIARAISPPSEVKEVREDSEGNPKSLKKRDSIAMNLREKFYGEMENLTGIRPVPNQGDYVRIKKALEYMKEREVTDMFEVAVAIGKIKTVREAFTDRAIDLKRQELV